MQPSNASEPRWSADRLWWWDGTRWIPAGQAPPAPPPPPLLPPAPALPPAYSYLPPAYMYGGQASSAGGSPGLRVVLIVTLAVAVILNGGMSVVGTIGVTGGDTSPTSIFLWVAFICLFLITTAGLVGVLLRRAWGRWVALAAGIALSVTVIGAVVGVPIIVGAARAPLARKI
jgi:hypothetical protein